MKLVVYQNGCLKYDIERVLFRLDDEKILLSGEQSQDAISERIESYLQALRDFNIYTDEPTIEDISSEHIHFDLVGFKRNSQ